MMFEVNGDLVFCDPALVKNVKPEAVFNTGVGACFENIHPVDEFKEYMSNREFYVKGRLNEAFNGHIPRIIGRIGTDSGNIGIFQLDALKESEITLKKGEHFKVRGFRGKIGRFYDDKGMLHIYAAGNYNFYTI